MDVQSGKLQQYFKMGAYLSQDFIESFEETAKNICAFGLPRSKRTQHNREVCDILAISDGKPHIVISAYGHTSDEALRDFIAHFAHHMIFVNGDGEFLNFDDPESINKARVPIWGTAPVVLENELLYG